MTEKATILLTIVTTLCCCSAMGAGKPLKVYILAGQSNMEGQARIETFDYIGDDPATAPMLKEMRGPDGKPRVCERVWISYLTGSPDRNMLGEGFGKLTAGYGSRSNPTEDGGKIGPEFTFGIAMEKADDGPILIIKTAWGGKSLNTDFRPPSAGPYVLPENDKGTLGEASSRSPWHSQSRRPAEMACREGGQERGLLPSDDRAREEGARRPQARLSSLRSETGL